jgi:hypothetical protein
MNTPVLFILFNRPDTTRKVFECIRKIKPLQLFIAADGPRKEKEGDFERCEEVKRIVNEVDWECELHTLFRSENLGCGRGPYEAINWFFEHVEQGIILEDDCLPSLSFFNYAQELLIKYKDNNKIWHIGGNSFYPNNFHSSYYYSCYGHIWGWATWRRAWRHYDFELRNINRSILETRINETFLTKEEKTFWLNHYDYVKKLSEKDFWDYQWSITLWYNNALSIIPAKNLINNIGFGENATHTFDKNSWLADLEVNDIVNIIHNEKIIQNQKADLYTSKRIFGIQTRKEKIVQRIKSKLKSFY